MRTKTLCGEARAVKKRFFQKASHSCIQVLRCAKDPVKGLAEDSANSACSGAKKHHGGCPAGNRRSTVTYCLGENKEYCKIKQSAGKSPEKTSASSYFSAYKTTRQTGNAIDSENGLIDLSLL